MRTLRQALKQSGEVVIKYNKFRPKKPRERLIRPDSEQTRWLSEQIYLFTMKAVELAGTQAELARECKIHPHTVMHMLSGELVNLRILGLIANRYNLQFEIRILT